MCVLVVWNNLENRELARTELKIGDYVEYKPDSAENYLLTMSTTGSSKNSSEGIKQSDFKWRVFNINDDGTVELISEKATENLAYFRDVIGYNNYVFLLNDICKKQYSNTELGVEARSINLLDIENKLSEKGIEERNSYKNSYGFTYGETNTYT